MSTVQERFYSLLNAKIGVEVESLTEDTTLESLDLDSLLVIEVTVAVEKEFGVVLDETELTSERTIGEVLATIGNGLKAVL
jgi:acyl carrier protein